MIIDFHENVTLPSPLLINRVQVERISSLKYLRVVVNNRLTWEDHDDFTIKKLHSRLYCLRKLFSFDVMSEILKIFMMLHCVVSGGIA